MREQAEALAKIRKDPELVDSIIESFEKVYMPLLTKEWFDTTYDTHVQEVKDELYQLVFLNSGS